MSMSGEWVEWGLLERGRVRTSVGRDLFAFFILAERQKVNGMFFHQSTWPSGLRRCVQVAVLIGAGSNPAVDKSFAFLVLWQCCWREPWMAV